MKKQKMSNGLFNGPVHEILPDIFDEGEVSAFFKGSNRAAEAITEADTYAPIDLWDRLWVGIEPISATDADDVAFEDTVMDGGGAKPSWSKGGNSTTTDTDTSSGVTTDTSGSKGNGKGRKEVAEDPVMTDQDTTAPATSEPAPTSEPTQALAADYVSGLDTPDGFNISINFDGAWSASQRQSVIDAAELISDIVVGDLPGVNGIDDLHITASITSIDGTGGYYGWGGTTSARLDSKLPDEGYLRLDSADMAQMEQYGLVDDFALHEILHAMGFGTSWNSMGLVSTIEGSLRFTGTNAIQAYQDVFASIAASDPLAAFGVPVEMDGGSGTAGVHWDHETFGTEMMTGTLNTRNNAVSDMTIAALEDMGYETIYQPDTMIFV